MEAAVNLLPRKQSAKRNRRKPYTKGELNALVDSFLHPLFREHPVFMVIDEIAHALIEQNPRESAVKFVRYSLPGIIKKYLTGQTST